LRSRDLVTAIRGVAGSGKTSMLDQAVRAIADLSGLDVMAFAPSASATEVMRKHGFRSAATVQKLLADPEPQRLATAKILLIDEAGFLSVREMRQLLSFAAGINCRVITVGRQPPAPFRRTGRCASDPRRVGRGCERGAHENFSAADSCFASGD
jgi:thymidine kinase